MNKPTQWARRQTPWSYWYWVVSRIALNTNRTNVCYTLDSVAQVNVIPENQIETLHAKLRITTSTTILSTYNGSNVPVNGKFTLDIQHQGNNIFLLFIVADTNFFFIIGQNFSRQSNPIKSKRSIFNSQKYNIHHITIDQNIAAIITPARKIPITLLDKLKFELEIMQRLDILEPVSELTEWVNPLVIVEKPNGKFRICVDFKYLNQAARYQHCKLPTSEELFSKTHNGKFFTKLVAISRCCQINVGKFDTFHQTLS